MCKIEYAEGGAKLHHPPPPKIGLRSHAIDNNALFLLISLPWAFCLEPCPSANQIDVVMFGNVLDLLVIEMISTSLPFYLSPNYEERFLLTFFYFELLPLKHLNIWPVTESPMQGKIREPLLSGVVYRISRILIRNQWARDWWVVLPLALSIRLRKLINLRWIPSLYQQLQKAVRNHLLKKICSVSLVVVKCLF